MPLKIGLDNRLVDHAAGGTATYGRQLARHLAESPAGHRFFVLRAGAVAPLRGGEVEDVRLWTPAKHRLEQWTLPLELARLRLDVLHSVDFIPPMRWRRFRSVITIHDLAFLRLPQIHDEEGRRYYGQIHKAVRSAERIIAVSASTAQDVLELLSADPGRVHVVHEAADPFFRPLGAADEAEVAELRTELGGLGRYVLFVGTIEPRKNLQTLLHAFSSVRREAPDVTLVLAGARGWLDDDVFALAEKLAFGDAVKFLGRVSNHRLRLLYGSAELTVLPSVYEGFGLTVLEAMACGSPVIASDTSSIPEVAGEAAILVEPEDVDGWAEALRRTLGHDELRARLREAGFARTRQFSWERAARETIAVYELAAADER